MREVLAADAKQQSESPDTQNAYLAQMGERKFNEVKDSNPRWADLYDPADPAAFLDNFYVIERKQAPPAVRPGDDLGLSAEDITPPMTPADKRRAGALRAQSKAGDLKARTSSPCSSSSTRTAAFCAPAERQAGPQSTRGRCHDNRRQAGEHQRDGADGRDAEPRTVRRETHEGRRAHC